MRSLCHLQECISFIGLWRLHWVFIWLAQNKQKIFEAFYNFENEVKEGFFNQFKYKLGLGYRLSYYWKFNIGVIYQNAENNIVGPSQLPVTVNTNWILEWGGAYIFPPKRTKK